MNVYSESLIRKIQSVLDEAVANEEVPCYSILVHSPKGDQYWESGFQNIEKGIPLSRNTIFRIYSCTKIFTSFCALLAVEEGKLDLSIPVKEFIPAFSDLKVEDHGVIRSAKRDMLVSDLLAMRSGLAYPDPSILTGKRCGELLEECDARLDTSNPMTGLEFASEIGKVPLCNDPGAEFRYSISADILGVVLEVIYHDSLDRIMQRLLFDPLGLADTGFVVPKSKQGRIAQGYRKTKEGPLAPIGSALGVRADGGPTSFYSGGAGLYSTIDDMMRFAIWLLHKGEGLLPSEHFDRWVCAEHYEELGTIPWKELPGYRYANLLRIKLEDKPANRVVAKGEFGWDGALGTYLKVDPANGICYVMATQREGYGTGALTRALRQELAKEEDKR